jgi:hypothetical protein
VDSLDEFLEADPVVLVVFVYAEIRVHFPKVIWAVLASITS